MAHVECLIWGTSAGQLETTRRGYLVDSARAGGVYFISLSANSLISGLDPRMKALLTTYLVDQHALGVEEPEVTTEIIEGLRQRTPVPVHRRADRFLEYVSSGAEFVGLEIPYVVDEPFYLGALAVSESVEHEEAEYLLRFLVDRGYLEASLALGGSGELKVTMEGYARMAELKSVKVESAQGFVAMWFDKSLDDVCTNGIERAIRDAGYKPLRLDRADHNNKIDDQIVAEIRRSRFVVADFTQEDIKGARGGVYYEAGFAHGLGIPVIFTCRADAVDRVHFDTRQYNHIAWSSAADLRDRLTKRIAATIGDGPERKDA